MRPFGPGPWQVVLSDAAPRRQAAVASQPLGDANVKQFACGDVVPGCQSAFVGADDEVILAQVAAHAHADHGLTDIPDSLVQQVRDHIVRV